VKCYPHDSKALLVENKLNVKCRHEHSSVPVHEIIFSAVDKPKLLSQV